MLLKRGIAVIFVLFLFFYANVVRATASDFADFFNIDLEQNVLPTQQELEKILSKYDVYNKKYRNLYDLLGDFDEEFYLAISTYGMSEKRIKGVNEDLYLEFFRNIPQKYYQYLGPMLFEVPDMSDKVLNLPGIKETKNKFPTRIAKQLTDIEDLEFMSPALYFFLMPEAWPDYKEKIEQPQSVRFYPKISYNGNFYAAIKRLIKPEKFMPGYKEDSKKSKSDLRTINPNKNSLLTSADVKAFIATIDDVDDWSKQKENRFLIYRWGSILRLYEKEDPVGKYVPSGLKDLLHPCARLVQTAKVIGKERELSLLVEKQGFTLNGWAYTCDKTIKAYRLANIRSEMVKALREYRRGIYDDEFKKLSIFTRNAREATMQSIVEAHNAPLSDVLEYKKNRKEFEQKLKEKDYHLFSYPINRY